MPTRPKRFTPSGVPSKQQARKQYDRERGSAHERRYTKRWQNERRLFLAKNPMCHDCMAVEVWSKATDVHHIKKLRDFPELQYKYDNLMALCHGCHSKRTARGE